MTPNFPDLMPLEEVFSKVKSLMKASDEVFQACTQLRTLLAMAFSMMKQKTVLASYNTVDTSLKNFICIHLFSSLGRD